MKKNFKAKLTQQGNRYYVYTKKGLWPWRKIDYFYNKEDAEKLYKQKVEYGLGEVVLMSNY